MMMPPRMTRTVMAAPRVRWRNAASFNRKRCRTLARSTRLTVERPVPCNATSTTGCLPDCIRFSLAFAAMESSQAVSSSRHKPSLCRSQIEKRALVGALSIGSIGHRENRLSPPGLDLVSPELLDLLDAGFGHRNIVQPLRHLAAVLVGPRKELERLAGCGRISRLLVDEDPRCSRHRPRLIARLIGEDHAVPGLRLPVGIGRRGLECFRARRHRLAGLVDHLGKDQPVLLGVSVLDISDRSLGVGDIIRNAFVTFGANPNRPLHRGVDADLRLPIRAHIGQVVHKVVGSARTVRTVHDRDRLTWQLRTRIKLLDRWIVPGLDFAEEDLGECRTIDGEFARLDAFEIDDRNYGTHDGGKLCKADLVKLFTFKRRVAGTKGDRLVSDLLNAAAGADRLIVKAVTGELFVGIGPFRINRVRKGGAGTRDIGCLGRNKRSDGDDACRCQYGPVFQGFSPCLRSKSGAGREATHGSAFCALSPGGFFGLKNALHDGFGYSRCLWVSEVWVSHKRRMSPFYKRLVTVT